MQAITVVFLSSIVDWTLFEVESHKNRIPQVNTSSQRKHIIQLEDLNESPPILAFLYNFFKIFDTYDEINTSVASSYSLHKIQMVTTMLV